MEAYLKNFYEAMVEVFLALNSLSLCSINVTIGILFM